MIIVDNALQQREAEGRPIRVGLIGAGFLCVPILTGSAAYAVAEALGWRRGLDEKPRRAKLFYQRKRSGKSARIREKRMATEAAQ